MNKYLCATLCLTLLSSCFQLTRFESGKTVGKNNVLLSSQAIFVPEEATVQVQVNSEFGLTDKVDLGVSVSSAWGLLVNGKFQLVGDRDSKFALSINPALEVIFDPLAGPYLAQHLYAPMSLDLNDRFTLLFEPRYIHVPRVKDTHLGGFSSGLDIKMKKDWILVIGGSAFFRNKYSADYTRNQFHCGVGFKKLIRRKDRT